VKREGSTIRCGEGRPPARRGKASEDTIVFLKQRGSDRGVSSYYSRRGKGSAGRE